MPTLGDGHPFIFIGVVASPSLSEISIVSYGPNLDDAMTMPRDAPCTSTLADWQSFGDGVGERDPG